MKTPEEMFADLGNRGEYAALPHVTLAEVKMIYAEGQKQGSKLRHTTNDRARIAAIISEYLFTGECNTHAFRLVMQDADGFEIGSWSEGDVTNRINWVLEDFLTSVEQQHAALSKLRTAINEAIGGSGTGSPQDWTAAQVVLCQVLEEVRVMLGEK